MKNPSPPCPHHLTWLALAAFGTLLLLPATRPLLKTQLKMETLTYSAQVGPSMAHAVAAQSPQDYPMQLAHAIGPASEDDAVQTAEEAQARNRRIEALARRFPDNPSVYANLLRYMTQQEVQVQREQGSKSDAASGRSAPPPPSAESLERFENAARRGALLDPDNAYFPMMQAIGLLNAHRDVEALEALKTAGRCTHWTEYFQDDVRGQDRMQSAAYGDQSALQQVGNFSNLVFPQYGQLRAVTRVAVGLAADAERAGNVEEGIAVRHALMRCGGLLRAQGDSFISRLVGVAISTIATTKPGGLEEPAPAASTPTTPEASEKRRAERLERYYAYLERVGHPQEAAWAKTEIEAGAQARTLAQECVGNSVLSMPTPLSLGTSWIVNIALLFSVFALLALGGYAHMAQAHKSSKRLGLWRAVFAFHAVGGIWLWQWNASAGGTDLCGNLQYLLHTLLIDLFGAGKGYDDLAGNRLVFQTAIAGLSLVIPGLLVGLIAVLSRFQKVPLATGIGRGLRGAALPVAAVVFLLYGISLVPTAYLESKVKAGVARSIQSEPLTCAEDSHKVWPGDPQP